MASSSLSLKLAPPDEFWLVYHSTRGVAQWEFYPAMRRDLFFGQGTRPPGATHLAATELGRPSR